MYLYRTTIMRLILHAVAAAGVCIHTLTTAGFPKSRVSQLKPCGRLYGSSRMLSLSGSMQPCDVTISPERKQNLTHETQTPLGSVCILLPSEAEVKEQRTSHLVWAQAGCPRTGNSSVLPPPWFWPGLGLQRTVRWPFGSLVVYQLAVNSPVRTD